MTATQLEVLQALCTALDEATDCGLLDELAAEAHPDTINAFCDVASSVFAREIGEKSASNPTP